MNTPVYSGIITNYTCTAACRHCMFASSPERPKEFITPEMSDRTACLLKKAKTSSVHIGGGEPFLHFRALCSLIESLNRYGIGIDYIETNAFWCSEDEFTKQRLHRLRELGVTTVMVSVDPFHIEFVPLERPVRLCRLLREMGFDFFIWKERYLRRFRDLDWKKTYSKDELSELLGRDYITETAAEYGVGMNGRALAIADQAYGRKPAEAWSTPVPCTDLLEPCHCHFDLYGNAVPSGCPGLAMEAEDYLTGAVSPEKYPVMARLFHGGTAELDSYARERGFSPAKEGYPTRCAFCYAMRRYLAEATKPSPDLAPLCFYEDMKKHTAF
ncbi:MAG: radical SAM protein [Eubacteriales bacterium]